MWSLDNAIEFNPRLLHNCANVCWKYEVVSAELSFLCSIYALKLRHKKESPRRNQGVEQFVTFSARLALTNVRAWNASIGR